MQPGHFMLLLTLSLAFLRVATLATGGLLKMVGFGPATTAQGVRLVPALTERWCSLRLGSDTKATDQDRPPVIGATQDRCVNVTVLSQSTKVNHNKSYVRTFTIDIIDKTCRAAGANRNPQLQTPRSPSQRGPARHGDSTDPGRPGQAAPLRAGRRCI